MRPFAWTGGAIPDGEDSVKQMLLQLDDDDPEVEQRIRNGVEGRVQRGIGQALRAQKEEFFGPARQADDPQGYLRREGENALASLRGDGRVRDAVRRALIESVDLGVSVSVAQFDQVGFGFNWLLANEEARRWAESYTYGLVSGIDDTTVAALRRSMSAWIDSGAPLSVLENEVAHVFGSGRAELIASTEVTRAFAEANRIAYRESGVVEEVEWRVAADERVCPECGPLEGERSGLDGDFGGLSFPPLHPRCRCWIVPVISTPPVAEEPVIVAAPGQFSDLEEATAWARQNYPGINWDFEGAHVDMINPTMKQFDALAKDWPDVVERLEYIGTYRGADAPKREFQGAIAHASHDGKRIGLNPSYYGDPERFLRSMSQMADSGWLDADQSIESVLSHEFGHQVWNWVGEHRNYTLQEAQRFDGRGWFDWLVNEFDNRYKPTQMLSTYSTTLVAERHSEAFASRVHMGGKTKDGRRIKYVQRHDKFLNAFRRMLDSGDFAPATVEQPPWFQVAEEDKKVFKEKWGFWLKEFGLTDKEFFEGDE